MNRLSAVAKKEFLEIIRNPIGLILIILAPIFLFFLFAYGMPLDVKNIPMAVLDEDRSPESRSFVDSLKNSKTFDVRSYISDFDEIDQIIRKGDIRLCVVIPNKFSENIKRSRPQNIPAFIDATYTNRATIIGGYIEMAVSSFNDEILKNYFNKKYGLSHGEVMPVQIFTSPWFNPTFISEYFIVPGVIAIILIFLPPILASISLVKEKETGSILNMYCSPVTKTEYILGKAIPYITFTYINFFLYLFFTITVFKVPMNGSFLLLSLTTLIYVFSVIGIGFFIGTLVNSQIAAIMVVSVTTLTPSFMYSGFMNPLICLSDDAKYMAYMLPATYYIDFIRKLMLKGVGLNYLIADFLGLVFFAFILFLLSILIFKKKLN